MKGVLLVLSAAFVGLAGSLSFAAEPKRPNVLVILTDDQRADTLSIAGSKHPLTPNIDRLAKEGVWFKNYFCTTSLCSPSRGSILTGLYAHTHGVTNNFTEYPDTLATFPRALQSAGYETGYIGKYHMGEDNDDKRPGFDHFVTHKGQGKYFDTEFRANGGERKVVPGYYTHVVTDMAIDFLKKPRGDKPFMLMIGHKAPHSFYFPEKKYEKAFDAVPFPYPKSAFMLDDKPEWFKLRLDTWHGIYGPLFDYRKKFPDRSPEAVKDFEAMQRAYLATILSVDDSVGKLYEHLKSAGQLDNTLILFMADNGILSGEHGMVDKRTAHEPSLRIPLVARLPGVVPTTQMKTIEEQVLTLDICPSILEMCGLHPDKGVQGRSFKKLVTAGDPDWRKSWYYEYNYEKQFPYTPNVRALRTDRYKYIRYPHGDGSPDKHMAELYDLKSDPEETKNLIADPQHAKLVEELRAELDRQIKQYSNGKPDVMPVDQGIGTALPDAKIR
ncbi:sulfatase family protein [Humisphaera borealis]|uniref:Sulfatase n=1 Tax=Humisphaera borealis TaxID=2807512 RepID=A0A7M2X4M2_9BACT|nr:sulfatase [Humisphaera borealis]QOV92001.1 sulfatase [Humisphaera borealis]